MMLSFDSHVIFIMNRDPKQLLIRICPGLYGVVGKVVDN